MRALTDRTRKVPKSHGYSSILCNSPGSGPKMIMPGHKYTHMIAGFLQIKKTLYALKFLLPTPWIYAIGRNNLITHKVSTAYANRDPISAPSDSGTINRPKADLKTGLDQEKRATLLRPHLWMRFPLKDNWASPNNQIAFKAHRFSWNCSIWESKTAWTADFSNNGILAIRPRSPKTGM